MIYAMILLISLLIALCGAIFVMVLFSAFNGEIDIEEWEEDNRNNNLTL